MKNQSLKGPLYLTFAVLWGSLFTISCSGKKDNSQAARGPASYKVMTVSVDSATLLTDYPALLRGEQDIEIRPKIDGYIESIFVTEGAVVRKGQPLFKIRNPQYEQDVRSATAAISSVEAEIAAAQLQVTKVRPLVEQDIISKFELESAELSLRARKAALEQAQAALTNAKTNLGYTTLNSPVSGMVGELPYKLGSYVNSGTAQPLTVISNIEKIYAYFSLNEKQQLEFARNAAGGTFQQKIAQLPPVTLIMPDGTEYGEKGRIETISGQVSVQTGSYNVRAGFPNSSALLRSGNSATVRIYSEEPDVILVPQKTTFELQGKKFVYVIGQDSTLTPAEIAVRPVPGGQQYIVDKGLEPGQTILLEGVGILTSGAKIAPNKVSSDSLP
ncbi:MAG: efflux transporter periplasmic adaptor subunit [Cytophagaceae bacterium SCN 52-12]|nr:MAG: efflux transporter periplasmic adaptor subunit [Cytophagaceae bacterium SCN 52-12]